MNEETEKSMLHGKACMEEKSSSRRWLDLESKTRLFGGVEITKRTNEEHEEHEEHEEREEREERERKYDHDYKPETGEKPAPRRSTRIQQLTSKLNLVGGLLNPTLSFESDLDPTPAFESDLRLNLIMIVQREREKTRTRERERENERERERERERVTRVTRQHSNTTSS